MPFSCGGQSCPVIPNDVCPSRRLGGMRTAFVTLAVRFLLTLLTYHLSATADYRGQLVDMHPNWTQLDDCGPPPVRNSSIDSLMPRNNPHAFLEEDVCYTLFTECLSSGIGDISGETVLMIVFLIGTVFIYYFIRNSE